MPVVVGQFRIDSAAMVAMAVLSIHLPMISSLQRGVHILAEHHPGVSRPPKKTIPMCSSTEITNQALRLATVNGTPQLIEYYRYFQSYYTRSSCLIHYSLETITE